MIIKSFPGKGHSVRESIAVGTYVNTGFYWQLEDALICLHLDAFHGLDLFSTLLFDFFCLTFLQLRVEFLRLGSVPSEKANTIAFDELLSKQ